MTNIIFLAEDHYGAKPGAHTSAALADTLPHTLIENDWSPLADGILDNCDLLIINGISGVGPCTVPDTAEAPLKKYLESGKPLLLVHAGSAAFGTGHGGDAA